MIDVKNKVIYNGYGTVLIGGTQLGITITEVRPAQEIGVPPEGEYELGEKITLPVDETEAFQLLGILRKLKENPEGSDKIILAKGWYGWQVSFEEYNEKSVEVWIKAVCKVLRYFTMALAC